MDRARLLLWWQYCQHGLQRYIILYFYDVRIMNLYIHSDCGIRQTAETRRVSIII